MKSILQDDKRCYICGNIYNLHMHHIYGGGNRRISENNGFKVWLCALHHNMSNQGVRFNREADLRLKRICQKEYEKTHTRTEFFKLIGKNFLEEK